MDYEDYQREYQQAAAEIKLAVEEFNAAQARLLALQRKMAALGILMSLSNPQSELTPAQSQDLERAEKIIHATGKPSDAIRRIFLAASGPLTPKEIREALRKSGYDLTQHKNVAAMIDSVCKRLAEQGYVIRRDKGTRRVWEKVV